ncbi:hypothetical protein QAD02_008147 [Eretmocerus hayati]|uniref:Uncharacterized protein n=1 Tax=Eretmocerus hayati TaxID=131215 RepID=A0ACC2N5N6_9HYME|nr:hypothetical protein QAD02_008147 [Eretmocerus hayati]
MNYSDVPYSAMAYQPIFARFTQLTAEQLEAIQQPPHIVAYLLNVDLPSPSTDSGSWDSSSVICLDPSESSETESVICLDTFDDSDSVICLDTFDDSDSVICLDTFNDRNSVICLGEFPVQVSDNVSDIDSVIFMNQPTVSRFVQGIDTPFSPQDLEALSDWSYTPRRDPVALIVFVQPREECLDVFLEKIAAAMRKLIDDVSEDAGLDWLAKVDQFMDENGNVNFEPNFIPPIFSPTSFIHELESLPFLSPLHLSPYNSNSSPNVQGIPYLNDLSAEQNVEVYNANGDVIFNIPIVVDDTQQVQPSVNDMPIINDDIQSAYYAKQIDHYENLQPQANDVPIIHDVDDTQPASHAEQIDHHEIPQPQVDDAPIIAQQVDHEDLQPQRNDMPTGYDVQPALQVERVDNHEILQPVPDNESASVNVSDETSSRDNNDISLIDLVPHESLVVQGCPYKKAQHPIKVPTISQGKQLKMVWDQLFEQSRHEIVVERQKFAKEQERKEKTTTTAINKRKSAKKRKLEEEGSSANKMENEEEEKVEQQIQRPRPSLKLKIPLSKIKQKPAPSPSDLEDDQRPRISLKLKNPLAQLQQQQVSSLKNFKIPKLTPQSELKNSSNHASTSSGECQSEDEFENIDVDQLLKFKKKN